MSKVDSFLSAINLARSEIKNIRQESLKQRSQMNSEVFKIKQILKENGCNNKLKSDKKENLDKFLLMAPIGHITSCFKSKNGIPRQPSLCPTSKGTLTINKSVFTNPQHSLIGLEEFSHIWVLFAFHENGKHATPKAKIHPPRLDGASVGVFSTRSPHRPSAIGLSLIKLDKIEGSTLHLSGIDLLDGTPVIDIKPYIPLYDTPCVSNSNEKERTENKYSCNERKMDQRVSSNNTNIYDEKCNVASYVKKLPDCLKVVFTNRALEDLKQLQKQLQSVCDYSEAENSITEVLRNDPRSVYRRQKCSDRLYYFSISNLHVTCWFDEDDIAEVLRVKLKS